MNSPLQLIGMATKQSPFRRLLHCLDLDSPPEGEILFVSDYFWMIVDEGAPFAKIIITWIVAVSASHFGSPRVGNTLC
jgi:hypothetical protein